MSDSHDDGRTPKSYCIRKMLYFVDAKQTTISYLGKCIKEEEVHVPHSDIIGPVKRIPWKTSAVYIHVHCRTFENYKKYKIQICSQVLELLEEFDAWSKELHRLLASDCTRIPPLRLCHQEREVGRTKSRIPVQHHTDLTIWFDYEIQSLVVKQDLCPQLPFALS